MSSKVITKYNDLCITAGFKVTAKSARSVLVWRVVYVIK